MKFITTPLISIVSIAVLFNPTYSDHKTWLFTNDILNHQNWITKPNCDGLEFPEDDSWTYQTDKAFSHVTRIILPKNGEIVLNDGFSIQFDEQSENQINCVKLKQIKRESWLNPYGWNNTDDPDNPAVPYSYRVPSKYDDVSIPDQQLANIDLDGAKFKSLLYGPILITKDNYLQVTQQSGNELEVDFQLSHDKCTDPTGCKQYLTDTQMSILCDNVFDQEHDVGSCEMPLTLVDFCLIPRCGALIRISTSHSALTLEKIKQKLKEYKSYSYVYKPLYEDSELNIFFTEKELTGDSIVDATDFYNVIKSDYSYYGSEISLEVSGLPLLEKQKLVRNMFSTVFSPLFLVLFVFGILFLIFSPVGERLNIRNRILGNMPISTFRMRYDNLDQIASVVEDQSMTGEENPTTAFENPMYEHASSSGSTSNETIASLIDVRLASLGGKTNEEIDLNLETLKDRYGKSLVEDVVDNDNEDLLLKEF